MALAIQKMIDAIRPEDIPPLENGDRLTRDEFERRYNAMPHINKAELIEGVVYMPSPVSLLHGTPHAAVMGWLGVYWARTPGVQVADNSTVRLDLDNEPQPDVAVFVERSRGGQVIIDEDEYIAGAPELVVEVASTTASIDLHDKFRAYRKNGVREYIVWRVRQKAIDWFILRDSIYANMQPDSDGVIHSEVFPGLSLNVPAMLAMDLLTVQKTVNSSLSSPEHIAFVSRLQQTAEAP